MCDLLRTCDDVRMPRVVRLETLTDTQDADDARSISVSARLEAVLDDGGRVLLLDGRGWTEGLRGAGADAVDDVWSTTSEGEIAETARVVVGPDEAHGGRSQADMDAGHWSTLAGTLRRHGVAVDAGGLAALPHDVVLSERLRALVGPRPR